MLTFFIVMIATILASCSGNGNCASKLVPTGSAVLSFISPTQFPAHKSNLAYLTVSNTSKFVAKDVTYSVVANNTGGTINIVNLSAKSCANINANDTCILQVAIGSDTNPGSFSVLLSYPEEANSKLFSTIKPPVGSNTINQQLRVNIGLLDLPQDTDSGADGITLLYPSIVTINPNGSTQVIVNAVVNSILAGDFNTINLTTANGTPLNFKVLSGNSGNGAGDLSYGSVVSFSVIIPATASQLPIYIQTAKNGRVISQGNTQNLIQIVNDNVGVLSVIPSNTDLNTTYHTQEFTIVNNGYGVANNINITLSSLNLTSTSDCGDSLAAGATCTYLVSFDPTKAVSGSANVTINYNNGQANSSTTATLTYHGTNPLSGLTIASGNNPNFNFAATTNTSQSAQITIKNTGNTDEKDIIFTVPNYFSLTSGITNSCTLSSASDISNKLIPNQSCNLTITYSNPSITSGTITVPLIANYTYGNSIAGDPVSVGLTYSTTQAMGILSITPETYTFPNIVANNQESIISTFQVVNLGDNTATNVGLGFSANDAALFTIVNSGLPNDCNNFRSLLANESCLVTVKFGPTRAVTADATTDINVNYIPYSGQPLSMDTSILVATSTAPQLPSISVQSITLSPNVGGNGSSLNPWQVSLPVSPDEDVRIPNMVITYSNTGGASAINFTVDPNLLSSGYSLKSNSCNNFTLEPNSVNSCEVVLLLDPYTVGEKDLFLSNITSTWAGQNKPQPTSWINPSSGSSQTAVFVNIVPVYGNAKLSVTPTNIPLGLTATATVSVSGNNKHAGSQTFTLVADNSNVAISPSSCTIDLTSGPNSCQATITGANIGVVNISAINSDYEIQSESVVVVPYLIMAPIKTVHPSDLFTLAITSEPSSDLQIILPSGFTSNGNNSYNCGSASICSRKITADANLTAGYYQVEVRSQEGGVQFLSIPVASVKNFAYIPSSVTGESQVELCDFNDTGLMNCKYSGVVMSNMKAYGVTISPTGLYAYLNMVNNAGGSIIEGIFKCSIDQSTKLLSNCILQNSLGNINSRAGAISINGSYFYVNDINNSVIKKCNISPDDGSLNNCSIAMSGLRFYVERLVLNFNGSNLFVNTGLGNLSCALNNLTGDIINCMPSGYDKSSIGLSFNLENTKVYFTSATKFCQYNSNTQQLSACNDPFNGLSSNIKGSSTGIGFSSLYAFISSTSDVYQCAIDNNTGLLSPCLSVPSSNAPRAEGITIFN